MKRYSLNRTKFLDQGELERLEAVLQTCEYGSTPRLLIKLALGTGARAQELLNLKRIDVFHPTQSIYIKGLKGSDDREIPLTSDLFIELEFYLESHTNERIFPFTYNWLLALWHRHRPIKKKFHALRHTFAIELYKKTKDIHLVKHALGHRSISNTMIYLEFDYSQERLRKLLCG